MKSTVESIQKFQVLKESAEVWNWSKKHNSISESLLRNSVFNKLSVAEFQTHYPTFLPCKNFIFGECLLKRSTFVKHLIEMSDYQNPDVDCNAAIKLTEIKIKSAESLLISPTEGYNQILL